ncbi:hypothetical protein BPTFM16_00835 [Altererythrobacter insulae]|nr:hypothetical protein BPTFM16_00835 [Altererythrobacter insulae]
MTDIEIIVSLVVLLGSLLLANIASNLADALRARRDLPIGFVPWAINFYLTGAFVTGLSLFWIGREAVVFDVVVFVSQLATWIPYIMVTRLLYPEHPDRWASVEEYYIANRHLILGILLIGPTIFAFNLLYYDGTGSMTERVFGVGLGIVPVIITIGLLMLTEKPKWHRAGWGFLITHRIVLMTWLAVVAGQQ